MDLVTLPASRGRGIYSYLLQAILGHEQDLCIYRPCGLLNDLTP